MAPFLSGGLKGSKQQSTIPVAPEESYPDYALRLGYMGAKNVVKGAAIPGQILGSVISSVLPSDVQQTLKNAPKQEGIFERAEKHLPESYSKEPEGFWENVYANTAQQLPFLALGGLSSILGSLPSAIGASVGSEAAKESGMGPLGQFTSGLAGGGLVAGLKAFKGDPVAWARRTAKNDYKKLDSLLERNPLVGDATQLTNDLYAVEHELMKSYDYASKQIRPYLKKSQADIYGGRITFADANSKMKDIKEALRDGSISGNKARSLAHKMVEAYETHLSTEGKLHPEYGIPYERSKNLYAADKGSAFLRHLAKKDAKAIENVAENPRTLALLFGKIGRGIDLASRHIVSGGGRIAKDLDLLLTNKYVQDHIRSVAESASIGDKAAVIARIGQLDKTINEISPEKGMFVQGGIKQ